ncbi:leucine-rich repeat domain-containing protein [Ruminococcus albus]|uniref:Leucine Rich repeat-containing protein n=1 Tax=Ruminococcus albus TaxID=1264 RepID=A0A1I1R7E2_RUMAL|nr:leucine-rich repeat domain-containing protein [Ruminococcus albus]SFD26220.1 hypothetical protein SAMN02910406_03528 [Ruminococcus albus]
MKKKKVIITVCVALCIVLVALVRVFTPYLGRPFLMYCHDEEIGKRGFHPSNELKSIHSLYADDPVIKFVKYCPELEDIYVYDAHQSGDVIPVDINDIVNPKLKSLYISGEGVNWSGLSKCTELEYLDLYDTNLDSFEDISGLENLETLSIIGDNTEVSLNKLNELKHLWNLDIYCSKYDINCKDFSRLERLARLRIFCKNDIDCDNFSRMENLEMLFLKTEGKISGLDKLDSVVSLTIYSGQVTEDEICGMDSLEEITIYNTKFSEEVESTLREKGVIVNYRD